MADRASFDVNQVPSLLAVSTADGRTIVTLEADPTTHGLQVTTTSTLSAAPVYGQKTVAVTNTAVVLQTHALTTGVIVQALAGNVGNVVIGDASVTTANGFQLQPGQATSAAVTNTNALYVNGTAGDGVCFIGS